MLSIICHVFHNLFHSFLRFSTYQTFKFSFYSQLPSKSWIRRQQENVSPCGGFPISFSSATDYHVGGDSIALTTLHPQSNFLFRGTLDPIASGKWSNFLPVVGEYGLGAFCEAIVAVPASWVGSQGIIQVVQNAEDGVHYQVRSCSILAYSA
jgi:hypothetical protein